MRVQGQLLGQILVWDLLLTGTPLWEVVTEGAVVSVQGQLLGHTSISGQLLGQISV